MSVSKKKDSFLMYRTWRGVFDNPDDHFVAQLITTNCVKFMTIHPQCKVRCMFLTASSL